MFHDTVTIYNKHKDANNTERWQRTVLRGVFWDATKGAVMRQTGASSVDSAQLIIPSSVNPGRAYKPPKAWASLPNKCRYWTLQSGDIVVRGAISQEVERSSKELFELDDVLTITSVDTKNFGGGMAHWEVSCK